MAIPETSDKMLQERALPDTQELVATVENATRLN